MFKTILGLASGDAGVAGADGEQGETAPHGAGQTGGVAGAEGEEGETAPHQAGLTGEMLTEKPTLVAEVRVEEVEGVEATCLAWTRENQPCGGRVTPATRRYYTVAGGGYSVWACALYTWGY